jgi:mannose-6-phosphate isomerase-like protein (cupin superfamily)
LVFVFYPQRSCSRNHPHPRRCAWPRSWPPSPGRPTSAWASRWSSRSPAACSPRAWAPPWAIPPHAHEYEDEYGYIIEGVWEVFLDGRTYEARTGTGLHCPRHTSHGFRNIGSTPGKMIWISTPGASVERFFDELGALPADAPPDMQKIVDIFTKYSIQVLPSVGT